MQASPSSHALPVEGPQLPSFAAPAATEHAMHASASHASSQQTPSTQYPLAHASAPTQGSPMSLFITASNTYTEFRFRMSAVSPSIVIVDPK